MSSGASKFVPGSTITTRCAHGSLIRLVVESRTARYVNVRDERGVSRRALIRHDQHANEWALLFGRSQSQIVVRASDG